MNAGTGALIDGDAHLAQSIFDILTTPIGSRVRRRDYGSLLFELIDGPFNLAHRMKLIAATALALLRWELRIRLTRIGIERGDASGALVLTVEGERTDRGANAGGGPNSLVRLTVPLRFPAPQAA